MKIYFDARWIGDHGIGRFARVLDQQLNLPHLPVSGSPSSPLDPLRFLCAILFKTSADSCVLSPGFNAPLFVLRPYIFTILDLNHIDRPENSTLLKRLYYRLVMKRAARKAFRVLTISNFSKQRIIDWTGIDHARVINVGCGVNSNYHLRVDSYYPGYPYFLCVSNRRAHKNEPRVLQAFAQAQIDKKVRLIFTGLATEALLKDCERMGITDRVVFAGRVPEEDLPSFYRGAIALVFPSLYEGFGLPVIEAMACGTPAITSNTTSLSEISEDAALLVDPLSVDQIAHGIERLYADEELRDLLSQKGIQQAAKYSWDEVSAKVKAVLNEVSNERLN